MTERLPNIPNERRNPFLVPMTGDVFERDGFQRRFTTYQWREGPPGTRRRPNWWRPTMDRTQATRVRFKERTSKPPEQRRLPSGLIRGGSSWHWHDGYCTPEKWDTWLQGAVLVEKYDPCAVDEYEAALGVLERRERGRWRRWAWGTSDYDLASRRTVLEFNSGVVWSLPWDATTREIVRTLNAVRGFACSGDTATRLLLQDITPEAPMPDNVVALFGATGGEE